VTVALIDKYDFHVGLFIQLPFLLQHLGFSLRNYNAHPFPDRNHITK
jgi:hypothetical protein